MVVVAIVVVVVIVMVVVVCPLLWPCHHHPFEILPLAIFNSLDAVVMLSSHYLQTCKLSIQAKGRIPTPNNQDFVVSE